MYSSYYEKDIDTTIMYLEYIPKLQFQSLMMVLHKSFIVLYRVIN